MSNNSAASSSVSEEPNSLYTVPNDIEESSIELYKNFSKIPPVGDLVYIKKGALFFKYDKTPITKDEIEKYRSVLVENKEFSGEVPILTSNKLLVARRIDNDIRTFLGIELNPSGTKFNVSILNMTPVSKEQEGGRRRRSKKSRKIKRTKRRSTHRKRT